MRYVTGALTVILLLLVLIFAIQNRANIDVSFLFWSFSAPKVLLILATYILGMLSGWGVVELIKRAF
jgi:putative membrane protein